LPLNASVLIEDWGFARFAITYLLATVAAFWLLRRQPSLVPTIIFLLVYATLGMISQLGYINSGNLHGSERALFVVILAALLTSTGKRVVPASIVLVGVFLSTTGFKKLNFSSPPREHAFLSAAWQKHLAEVNRNTGDGTIWSVYSGLPEAERRVFHYATDYIIHALGPSSRSRYVNLFLQTKPSLVRLDPPRWRFAAWLLLENWSFYYEVFRAYEPIYVDDLGSLWRPVRTPIPETQTVANDLDSQGCARLAAEPDDVIYSVDVLYEAKNPWRYLPALGQTPRWLLRVTGATNQIFETISVPGGSAYGGQFAFPVIAKGGQMISICPQVSSLLPGVDLKLTNLHVIRLRSSEPVMRYILNIEARPHS
jgi:hypothetical protein